MDIAKKRRRLVYLGIIFICFSFLALSISGLFRFTTYIKKEEAPILKEIIDEDSKRKQRLTQVPGTNDITQEIYGLYLPNYDDNGKVVTVVRGAYTVFLDNKIYRITKPEIEFTSDNNNKEMNQPKNIIITSDFGEMDKTTNKGFLNGNVMTRLGEDLEIYTDDLRYFPDSKIVNTDGSVTVLGKQMRITGTGFEISLSDTKATIKNDPEMEIRSNKDDLFLFSDQGTVTNKNIAESTFIRAGGELVFEHKKKLATFHDNVRISRGKSTVFADKLTVPFDSELKGLQKVIASGNVLASDGEKNAKGETLTWDSEKEIAILEDDPVAEFFDDKISITASKITFSKAHGRMTVPVSGQLTTVVNFKSKKQDKKNTNKKTKIIFADSDKKIIYDTITINWKGRMSFEQSTNQAIFEDDVIITKGSTKLYCEKLEIHFDNKNDSLEKMEATKNVYLIEKKDDSIREARGDKLIWTATTNYSELYGNNPLATVVDGDKQISAPKITFSEDENKLLAEGKGNLLAKTSSEKDGKETEHLNINWNKEMIYNGSNQVANFYETIKVIKGKEKLDCDRLDVFFDGKDKIKKITAFGSVYIASPDSDNTEGLGTLLVWDLTKDLAELTGNPLAELRRSGARTFSEKIYFDIKSKRVHWEGRPHWKIFGALE